MVVVFGTYGLAFWSGNEFIEQEKLSPGAVLTVLFGMIMGAMAIGQVSLYSLTLD